MLELRLLGEIQLTAARPDNGRAESLLAQPKRLALLAYLASPTPGSWHRRDMLLALFWPELDTRRARTSLRNTLYVIRQTLGDAVLRSRGDEEVSIDPAELRTDLADLLLALREGRAEDALSLYSGELLPGLFPPDSEGFMRWLDTERARLKVAVAGAGIARIDELERIGNIAGALALARRLLAKNSDDESLVRRTMLLHERNGDRAGALLTFESYRAWLADELDAEPSEETLVVARRLRAPTAATIPRPGADAAPPSATLRAHPPSGGAEIVSFVAPRRWRWPAGAFVIVVASAFAAWRAAAPSRPQTIGKSAPLTTDEGLQVEAAIAPNGRLVAFAKGTSHALHIEVQRIGGGPAWRLTNDSTGMELLPRWAPDNDQILYISHNSAYVAPALGGSPRVVAQGEPGDGRIFAAAWSPRGDSIVIARNDSLIVVPLTGGGQRVVAFAKGRQLHSCVWSPNVAWIACVAGNRVTLDAGPLFANAAPSAIVLVNATTGRFVQLTSNDAQNQSPAWSADGRFLWFASNRDGPALEAYAVSIGRDGRPSGPIERVGFNAASISLSANRLAYAIPARRANLWAIPVPRDTVTNLAAAGQRITSGMQVIELVSAAPDGKSLVYDSDLSGNADIYRMPIGGGSVERLTDDPRPEFAPALSPDGRDLVWQRWVGGLRRLYARRLDPAGPEREISFGPGDQGVAKWSPDGKSIAAWSHNTEEGAVFVMHRDAAGAWQPPAWRLQGGRLPVWSPDGRTLAFIWGEGGIATIPADSGTRRVIYSPGTDADSPIGTQLIWSLDPSTVWFTGNDRRGRGGIWSISVTGDTPRLRVNLDDPSGRTHGTGFTTDGTRFYFPLEERISNVRWADLVRR